MHPLLGRGDDVQAAAVDVDLLVIATPDAAVAEVAAAVEPVAGTVVAHLSGSLGLDSLAPHGRRASIHPLLPLPDPERGAARLRDHAPFAVAGDPFAYEVVAALGGRAFEVDDDHRVAYHAAASIAANHLVALLGQVERVAATAGVPLEAYLPLVRATVEDVATVGPAAALTGPVKRGDHHTVAAHLDALDPSERPAYQAMAGQAARLAGAPTPPPTVIDTITGFRAVLDAERAAGRTVGLVPTMGFLHDGHASLMRRAVAECDVVAATIFVNPLQFGPHEDFDRYPRDLDRDLAVAAAAGVRYVFAPPVDEMYPEEVLTTVHVAGLTEDLEGAVRPGHFDGVATVVAKLFNAAGPCRAYFGEKDWQQLAVVRRMAADLSFPVEVVGCPIVREADGLAMSSRNVYLSPKERMAATVLYRALLAARDSADPVATMKEVVATEPLVELDYAEQVGDRLLVAARVGTTRLIDNMGVR
ncbi:MAG TPA: pantoate--beta-alanine ligase [Acidimicrobiales bacterium]|nr:pantoate--beta-alanine ligase [Acidimicrobiales bacterium]